MKPAALLAPWHSIQDGWERRSFDGDLWVSLNRVRNPEGRLLWSITVYAHDKNGFRAIGWPIALPADGDSEVSLEDAQKNATYFAGEFIGDWYKDRVQNG